LLFFHRHPRAVLTSERLALYVGYELAEVARSIDALIGGGLLSRVQKAGGVPRMYVLNIAGPLGGWLDALLRLASTREGRLTILAALSRAQAEDDRPRAGRHQPANRRRASVAMEVRHA
jgi:hypothetical protein